MREKNKPAKIGEIMALKKWVKAGDIESALQEQRKTGELLGQILLKRGILTEDNLYRALAFQYGMRYLEPEKLVATPEALALAPLPLARRWNFFPLYQTGSYLWIAISNPAEMKIEEELGRLHPSLKIFSTIASPAAIRHALAGLGP